MHEPAIRVSALSTRAGLEALPAVWHGLRVGLRETPFASHINLRGDATQRGFLSAVHAAVGCYPPVTPNTVASYGETRLAWLGPDEWLIVAPEGAEIAMCTALAASLSNLHHAVTVVSHGQTLIRVTGPEARKLLTTGCPLDLHPKTFAPPQCAQSHYLKAAVLIIAIDGASAIDVVVRRTFAEYLWASLVDAGSAL